MLSRARLERYLLDVWYGGRRRGAWLAPLGWVYAAAMRLRASLYAAGLRRVVASPVPVIVVGNLTVGGTGKTPLVVWLARRLAAAGGCPAVVSRGHGGHAGDAPRFVAPDDAAVDVGDEPLLIARRAGVPVVVDRDRARAVRAAAERGADVVVSDDGLQHLRMARSAELVVVDGARRFGNGRCLPAGPLRESPGRLKTVDAVLINGGGPGDPMTMAVTAGDAVRLRDGARRPLAAFAQTGVNALAGIGNPERFASLLGEHGVAVAARRWLPDHAAPSRADFDFGDRRPVLITEKDAVKCAAETAGDVWYLPVDAVPDRAATARLDEIVARCLAGRTP